MRTGIIVAALAVIALFWFNPTMGDFQRWIGAQTEDVLRTETGTGELARILSELGSELAERHVARFTERNNYGVFSTYTIDFDGDDNGNEWRFLGLGGQFIELERPGDDE